MAERGEFVKSTQKILYGPPGTGKTWMAAREAVRAAAPAIYEDASTKVNPDTALAAAHKRLIDDGRIVWVTFHPSYSYEDFVEGYRPIVDDKGQLSYQVVDGPFKVVCNRARSESDLQIGEKLRDAKGGEAGQVVDKDPGGWLIRVRPERSDEVASEQFKYVSRLILRRFMDAALPPSVFSIPGSSVIDLREYGLNDTDPDVPAPDLTKREGPNIRNGSTVRRIVGGRAQVSSSDLANSSHYGAVYRRLLELKSGGGPSPVVIVIDEINRADLSRVFGELLTLLEQDKREGSPEEKRVLLPYSKALFSVPQNVSVIGTMNTVDRSLTAMDFAMRRRFEFHLVDVEPERCPADYGGLDLQRALITINRRISVLLGGDYRIGHASLMATSLDNTAIRLGWSGSADSQVRSVAHVWRSYIMPTLFEYFHEDWKKARAVAGVAESSGASYDLFEIIKPDDSLIKMLPEEYDLPDAGSFSYGKWWDPQDGKWSAEEFLGFLHALSSEG
jgi:5-methylcytosine-specific restriction enzyme B